MMFDFDVPTLLSSLRNPPFPEIPIKVAIDAMHNCIILLDPRRVKPMPDQPRFHSNPGFRPESIKALADSIKVTGQIKPVLVCRSDDPAYDAELVDGERRLRSSMMGGFLLLAQVDLSIVDREQHFLHSITANFHQPGHTCVEIAHAIKRLQREHTHKQIAQIFGKTETWVSNHISLLRLDPSLHVYLVEQFASEIDGEIADEQTLKHHGKKVTGKLTFQLALVISSLPRDDQFAVAKEILGKRMPFESARRYVVRYIEDKGIITNRSTRPPSESFHSLEKAARSAGNKFGFFTDKNPKQLRELFDTQPAGSRRALAIHLRLLRDDLGSLADILLESDKKK